MKTKNSPWPLVVIMGGPFLLGGLAMLLISTLPTLWDAARAQGWIAVEARIDQLEWQAGESTYQVEARYRYRVDGRWYANTRVELHRGADSFRDAHRDRFHELRKAFRRQQAVIAWVNPERPAEAVLDRRVRWQRSLAEGLFSLVFISVGVGVVWMGRREQALRNKTAHGAGRVVRSDLSDSGKVMAFMAFMFAVMPLPALLALPEELAKGNWAILAALLFPLTALWLAWMAIRAWRERRRFGEFTLSLDPYPGQIGGDVAGSVELREPFRPDFRFHVELRCMRIHIRRHGKNRRSESLVWHQEGLAFAEPGIRGTRLRFAFAVPDHLPPTSEPDDDYHEWSVHLHAELPGVDLNRRIPVPVEQSATPRRAAAVRYSNHVPELAGQWPPSVQATPSALGGMRYHFPMGRNFGLGLAMTLFGVLFAAPGVGLIYFNLAELTTKPARSQGMGRLFDGLFHGVPVFMGTVFVLVGAGLLALGLFWLANTLTVVVEDNHLRIRRRFLGIGGWRQWPATDIVGMRRKIAGNQRGGGRITVYYTIQAITRSGRRLTVADGIRGSGAAERLEADLRDALLQAGAPLEGGTLTPAPALAG